MFLKIAMYVFGMTGGIVFLMNMEIIGSCLIAVAALCLFKSMRSS